jgi:hypothetical protein
MWNERLYWFLKSFLAADMSREWEKHKQRTSFTITQGISPYNELVNKNGMILILND